MPTLAAAAAPKRCFIAMPITTHQHEAELYRDDDHWLHIMEHLFVPAIEQAGFEAVRPVAKGSSMIHAQIIKNLEECEMVLCDLSSHNPNVFFELGVRTSLDKPIAIVVDDQTKIPFDLGGLNAYNYDSVLEVWSVKDRVPGLAQHLTDAEASCVGQNPLWQQYGLTFRAEAPEAQADESPTDAKLDLMLGELERLRHNQRRVEYALSKSSVDESGSRRHDSATEAGLSRVIDHEGFRRAVEMSVFSNSLLGAEIKRLSADDPHDFEIAFWTKPAKSALAQLNRIAQDYGVSAVYRVQGAPGLPGTY